MSLHLGLKKEHTFPRVQKFYSESQLNYMETSEEASNLRTAKVPSNGTEMGGEGPGHILKNDRAVRLDRIG